MPSTISAGTTAGTAIAIAGDTTGNLAFQTNGTTTAMTIDTSQNVGIGTASPVSQLTLAKTSDLVFTQNGYGVAWGGDNGSPRIYGVSSGTLSFKSGGGSVAAEIDSSSNFRFNSGYGSVAVAYGCRAWVKWTGTGGATINGSGNISSITRTGTGQFTVTMTNALPDTNYSIVGISGVSNSYQAGMINADTRLGTLTSSVFYISFNNYGGTAYTDPQFGCIAVFR